MAVPESPTEGPVAARRTLSLLVLVLTVFTASAIPASGQDFNFTAVPRVSFGLTNRGVVGVLCSAGVLNFSASGAGNVTATLQSGTDSRCDDPGSIPISGGSLTLFSANRSVMGTIGDETLFGQLLPAGHALVGVETFGAESVIPGGRGLSVFVDNSGTFSQGDLTGTWRITALTGEQGTAGTAEALFG